MQDPVTSHEVILVDEDSTQAGAGASEAKDAGGVEGSAGIEDSRQEEMAKE